jgi:hypothetical protein
VLFDERSFHGDSSGIDRAAAVPPDQYRDQKQIGNVGVDPEREGGRMISEMIVKKAGDQPPAAIPPPLNSNRVGIRREASEAGNSSRTARRPG